MFFKIGVPSVGAPQAQNLNWTYVRRSEDVQDVLSKFNLRPASTGDVRESSLHCTENLTE